ncbi:MULTISPECIES: capsular polysaccharide synthesis protein [unclassified Cobetia]|uniref:capsular polysaccharide synthesis protein n=1 Tax=unclassified Cobetia TaxID=2609414 RepID=UPI00178CCCE3|nr:MULTISPECIES: capsular polysaccharide synthesis protein [unclassified Cobetia]MBE2169945.1 hypothetical protein [Cobetia sp. 2AS1]MDH2446947.1 capsular polysaccharide synthesis protein [Cobetia sp. 2AS]
MKIIWICWLQGEDQAPPIVKNCIDSWRKNNPEWNVIVITKDNFDYYLEGIIPNKVMHNISGHYAALSDLIRVALLHNHGGVWADATTFCIKPLNTWLYEASPNNFFCFNNVHKDKTACSWFIYSDKYNPIISNWLYVSISYWESFNDKPSVKKIKTDPEVYKLLNDTNTSWFSPTVSSKLNIFPYFWFHMLLDEKVLNNSYMEKIYGSKTTVYSGNLTLSHRMRDSMDEKVISILSDKSLPMFKLTYKYNKKELPVDSIASYFSGRI